MNEANGASGVWICLDLGSTWTKATAVDPDALRILGSARARTTVETDVNLGVSEVLDRLAPCIGNQPVVRRLACSSAAGGLRMAAVGLVPELTAEAARRAAFSAGAKVIRTFTHELTRADLRELAAIAPDIVLLSGGTDGGNRRVLLHNASALATVPVAFPVVLAGNRSVAEETAEQLQAGGKTVRITENVMPEFGRLNLEPAREAIREVFLARIVKAKGLDRLTTLLDGILMPTPFAVLNAVRLLAQGHGAEAGWGDLLAVDLGGATTDIYSMASGEPTQPGVVWKGLPEPYAKRTVEGDLGVRHNARSISDTFGIGVDGVGRLAQAAGVSPEMAEAWLSAIDQTPGILPADLKDASSASTPQPASANAIRLDEALAVRVDATLAIRLDEALAVRAMQTALRRHAGTLEEAFTPMGRVFVQNGKDLTGVRTLLLTGGPLVDADHPADLGMAALGRPQSGSGTDTPTAPPTTSPVAPGIVSPTSPPIPPDVLLPATARLFLDRRYILAAMGLLAEERPLEALRILKAELVAL